MQEAEQALTLDKLLVIDRQIRVEPAHTAFESKGQSGGTQLAALQLQQIQQLQKAQMEQHSLAAQVAHMRVQAKQNPAAFNPGGLHFSAGASCVAKGGWIRGSVVSGGLPLQVCRRTRLPKKRQRCQQ